MQAAWAETVNHFWFEELDPRDWFSVNPQLDTTIRERFGELHAELQAQPPAPEGPEINVLLATVIVFDQFSRNIFRGSSQAYATDALALKLASFAVEAGLDKTLEARQRQFLYMPYMHSEDRAVQARSVQLFTELGLDEELGYAVGHKAIIDRFGRFPHRNAILGRESTREELEFLRTHRGF